MKKIIALSCALLMLCGAVFAFASCGKAEAKVKLVDIKLTEEDYAFAVAKDDAALLASVNELLVEMKQDGSFQKIVDKYFAEKGEKTGYPAGSIDPSKDQLVVATNAAFPPFEYMEGDLYYGVDIEIMAALAKKLNKELVINNMEFEFTIQSVESGASDIVAAGLTVNEERKKQVNFSESYYAASQMLIVPADCTTFDACKTAADVEAILNGLTSSTKIGTQNGTTGYLYVNGDADWGFAGFKTAVKGYSSAALAVTDMLNGQCAYVIVDEGPAKFIVDSMNGK